jgi:large-conductance mechanosensitive channel
MIIIRFILICLIVYLLVKGFIRSLYLEDPPQQRRQEPPPPVKKVSKEIGEFVDYEEVGKGKGKDKDR